MKISKSKNGYYYKIFNDGSKKRISKEKYLELKSKLQKNKSKKQKGGDGPILPEDILYQDSDVRILKPEVKKGILVFTHFRKPPGLDLCVEGLKTGEQLRKEGINFGRNVYHPYIFFKAPYQKSNIDYSTINTEINSSFPHLPSLRDNDNTGRAWIRVDPEYTNVYSSEIRARFGHNSPYLEGSKKRMTRYLDIIENNKRKIEERQREGPFTGRKRYHLISSEVFLNERHNNHSEGFYTRPIVIQRPIEFLRPISFTNAPLHFVEQRGLRNSVVIPQKTSKRQNEGKRFKKNELRERERQYHKQPKIIFKRHRGGDNNNFILNDQPIEENSEVLVRIPHLTPNFLVKCE